MMRGLTQSCSRYVSRETFFKTGVGMTWMRVFQVMEG